MTTTPTSPPESSALSSAGPLDLLVLGGTAWVGGAVAAEALRRGHRVTCLARGVAGAAPAGVRFVAADRTQDSAYAPVAGQDWDAVVEVGWQPDLVRSALAALAHRARHWVYVSSCSVYSDEGTEGQTEQAPVHAPHAGTGPVDWDVYGPAKVASELACVEAVGSGHVLLARAGLIAGAGDRSDRFGYWPARIARAARDGGRPGVGEGVLVPPLDTPVQVVDVGDLTTWLVDCAERRTAGTFNAVGDPVDVRTVLEACAEVVGLRPALHEASHAWLASEGVEPWAGDGSLPLWLPQPEYAGLARHDNTAARRAGMHLRPLVSTVTSSLSWETELGLDRARTAGLPPAREKDLLRRLAS